PCQDGVLERKLGKPRWQPGDRLLLAALSGLLPKSAWSALVLRGHLRVAPGPPARLSRWRLPVREHRYWKGATAVRSASWPTRDAVAPPRHRRLDGRLFGNETLRAGQEVLHAAILCRGSVSNP